MRHSFKKLSTRIRTNSNSTDPPAITIPPDNAKGLQIVAKGVNPTIDIVAVHGLDGHREKTWTATNGVNWLRDLLPTDIPNARILSWGYDANTHSSKISHQNLYNHAKTLVSDLCRFRKRTMVRSQSGRDSPGLRISNRHCVAQSSLSRVRQRNPISENLLQLWAYIDNQDAWLELLQACKVTEKPEWFSRITKDPLEFDSAMRVLCDHPWVEPNTTSQPGSQRSPGYSMHSCVHEWTFHLLNNGKWKPDMARLALSCLQSYMPSTRRPGYWILQQRLIKHANRCLKMLQEMSSEEDDLPMADCMHSLGDLYVEQGRLSEAEAIYLRALQGKEKAIGGDHKSTLMTMNNLGLLYTKQKKLVEAEEMLKRALQGKEQVLGPDHHLTLRTVTNLGNFYCEQGKLAEAKTTYQRSLRGFENMPVKDHISTLKAVICLGLFLKNQGMAHAAEEMLQRALKGLEKALGADHPLTLETMYSVGIIFHDQGKLDEAEDLYQRALQWYERARGLEHTSTLRTARRLGALCGQQGRLAETEKLHQRVMQGYQRALGADNPSTLNTVHGLGLLYSSQGKLVEAEEMYQRALQGYQRTLDADHQSIILLLCNLGCLYRQQGKLSRAEEIEKRRVPWILSNYGGTDTPRSWDPLLLAWRSDAS